MANTTTLNEITRSPIDGTEFIRLATAGANWKAQLGNQNWIFQGIYGGISSSSVLTIGSTTGVGTSDAIHFVTGSQALAMLVDTSGNVAGPGFNWFMTPGGQASFSVSTVTPLIAGGGAASSTLILESTFGVGTSDAIIFRTGSQVNAGSIDSNQNIIVGNGAIATNASNGFLYVETCAGTPTGTPTSVTGRVPIVFDTTNSQFWIYTGGAWKQPKTPAAAATVTWQ